MTVWPDLPSDDSDGNDFTAAKLNAIYAMFDALVEVPYFRFTNTTAQTITDDTLTDIDFEAMSYTLAAAKSATTADTAQITADANTTGLYMFGAGVQFATDADGFRQVAIENDGTNVATVKHRASPTGVTQLTLTSRPISIVATNKLQLEVHHTAGANLDVTAWNFWGLWVGKVSSAA